MKKKVTYILLTYAMMMQWANATHLKLQTKKMKRNVAMVPLAKSVNVKVNLAAIPFKNYSAFGEYVFHKNFTAQMGLRVMPKLDIARYTDNLLPDTLLLSPTMSGFAITPEFRFYPGKHEKYPAPHGLYIGLYGRYSRFNIDFGRYFYNSITTKKINFRLPVNQYTAGLIIGKQWAKKAFTLDWWILAFGVGTTTCNLSVSDPIFNSADIEKQLNAMNVDSKLAGIFGVKVTTGLNSVAKQASLDAKLPGYNIRSLLVGGLCLGYHIGRMK
jgi:hypothetical protein